MNSKHWPRIADFGTCDLSIPFNARGIKTKQAVPPPPPPAASDELLAKQKELEEREAAAKRAEEERKRLAAGAAAAEIAAGESEALQGQFRTRQRQRPGREGGTGLRF